MARKEIFLNKKYILSSDRELDLSAELVGEKVVISAMFNMLDPIQEKPHAVLVRLENNGTVSFESPGSSPEKFEDMMPIEGINGTKSVLKIYELNELISVMQQFLQKIEKDLKTKV